MGAEKIKHKKDRIAIIPSRTPVEGDSYALAQANMIRNIYPLHHGQPKRLTREDLETLSHANLVLGDPVRLERVKVFREKRRATKPPIETEPKDESAKLPPKPMPEPKIGRHRSLVQVRGRTLKGEMITAEWGKIKTVAAYAGVSERTVENWLRSGLRYIQLPSGLRLIKFQWVDDFLERFNNSSNQVDRIVEEVMAKI